MKDLPGFCYPMGYQHPSITKAVFRVSVLVKVCIVIILLTLLNNILDDLINRDIERLYIASTATRNNRDCGVGLFEFIDKVVCFLLFSF
jgi:hypothetical protein